MRKDKHTKKKKEIKGGGEEGRNKVIK